MLKMAGSTPEIATIVCLSSDLRQAVQDDLLDLSLRLQGCQPPILNQDNAAEVTNTMVAAPERAGKLVGYITNRVRADPRCYHALVKVFEANTPYYKHILDKLSETFASLKRQEGTAVAECAEVCSTGACGGTSTREVGKDKYLWLYMRGDSSGRGCLADSSLASHTLQTLRERGSGELAYELFCWDVACYILHHTNYVMSHDQKRASDRTRQDPVTEQLAIREFTRPSFSERLKCVACETLADFISLYIPLYDNKRVGMFLYGSPRHTSVILTQRDLPAILKLLSRVVAKWKQIAPHLNPPLPNGAVDEIDVDNRGKSKDCSREMIRKWLQRVKPCRPSWQKLKAAIEDSEIDGGEEIVEEINNILLQKT